MNLVPNLNLPPTRHKTCWCLSNYMHIKIDRYPPNIIFLWWEAGEKHNIFKTNLINLHFKHNKLYIKQLPSAVVHKRESWISIVSNRGEATNTHLATGYDLRAGSYFLFEFLRLSSFFWVASNSSSLGMGTDLPPPYFSTRDENIESTLPFLSFCRWAIIAYRSSEPFFDLKGVISQGLK